MKRLLFLSLLFLIPSVARAQVPVVSVLPANCSVGQQVSFLGTVYTCTAIDTWTPGASGISLPTTLTGSIIIAKNCSIYSSAAACFQAAMNGFQQNGCSWSSASAAITCPAGTFASSMVGEDFGGYHTCQTNATLYRSDFAAGTTISSFTDSAHVTVSNNSTNAETGTSNTGCVMAATLDDAVIASARAFWIASPVCLNVFIGDGIMGLKDPHNWFGSSGTGQLGEPVACANNAIFVGEGAGASYTLSGAGPSTTIIWLPPDFVAADCNSQSSYGIACFWNSNGLWRDMQFNGGGHPTLSIASNSIAIFFGGGQVAGTTASNQFSFFANFYAINVAPQDGTCFSGGLWWEEHRFVYEDGCGALGVSTTGSGSFTVKALDSKYVDNGISEINMNGASASFLSMGGNQFWDGPLMGSTEPVLYGNITLTQGDAIIKNGATNSYCWGGGGNFVVNVAAAAQIGVVTCNETQNMKFDGVNQLASLSGYLYTGTATPSVNVPLADTGVRLFLNQTSLGSGATSIQGNGSAPQLIDETGNTIHALSADVTVTCEGITDAFCQRTSGTVTLSAGAGSHTFTTAYITAPVCTAVDTTSAAAVKATSSTTAITLAGTGTDVISWTCLPANP